MKLKTLLEAKFAKTEYAYHATLADNLSSILKLGLIPNKLEGGYGSEDQSDVGYELTPLSGVYFTKSAKSAEFITHNLNGRPIIVVAKIQTRDSDLDEDRLVANVVRENAIKGQIELLMRDYQDEYDTIDLDEYSDEISAELQELIKKESRKILSRLISEFDMHEKVEMNVFDDIINYVTAITDFVTAYYYGEHQYSDDIKRYQNILTKKLKNIQHGSSKHVFDTFKIDKPIGYSGANRIVGFVCLDTEKYWGDYGDVKGNLIKVKRPLEILED